MQTVLPFHDSTSPSSKHVEVLYTLGDEVAHDYDSSIAGDSIGVNKKKNTDKSLKLNVQTTVAKKVPSKKTQDAKSGQGSPPKFAQVPVSTFTGGDFNDIIPVYSQTTKFSSRQQTPSNVSKISHVSHLNKERVRQVYTSNQK